MLIYVILIIDGKFVLMPSDISEGVNSPKCIEKTLGVVIT